MGQPFGEQGRLPQAGQGERRLGPSLGLTLDDVFRSAVAHQHERCIEQVGDEWWDRFAGRPLTRRLSAHARA